MSRKLTSHIRAFTTVPAIAAGLLSVAGSATSFGQTAPHGTGVPEQSRLVTLAGNTHPFAQARFDRGLAPASLSGRMLLTLKRSPEQEAALDQWIASQQNPASPNFHKWLTPEEFGKRFGVTEADLQRVTSYLSAEGFNVGRVYGGRNAVEITGTAEQIRRTFRTEIRRYAVRGRTFYANDRDPQIPAELASVVQGFASINNFKTTVAATATPASFDPATHRATPLYDIPSTGTYGVSPADLSTIYHIPGIASTYGQGGKGVKIGFVGDSNINLSYIENYRATFGLTASDPIIVLDGNDPGVTTDANIAYKQIELAGAVAPNASIYYYAAGTTDYDTGLDFALIRAIEDNTVQVLGVGYQSCETALGGSMAFFNQAWKQAAAQGMTIVVEAGNSGSAGCDVPGSSAGAVGGLAVNGMASTPYATAVGGTDFYYGTNAYSKYWNTKATGYSSALSYIPEQAWNDSNTGNDSAAGTPSLLAGGGGPSTAGADGVNTPTAQPSYQIGVVPSSISSTARVLPDVSFFAGTGGNNTIGFNNSAYLFCMANSDCKTGASQPQFTLSGGTEASTAVFAGAMALVVAYQNTLHTPAASIQNVGLGNVNSSLYYFVKNKVGTYHDVTVGNNKVQCSSTNCTNGYMTGYAAGTGYDAATGLGSFDITSLVSNWPTPNSTSSATTVAVTNPTTGAPITTVQHSSPVSFTATVTGGGSAVPTGDVAIFTNSPLAAEAGQDVLTLSTVTNSNGTKVGQAVDPSNIYLPGGTYQIAARYAGDTTYGPSVSTAVTITVTPEPSKMVVYGHNVNYSGSTVPYGSPVQITAEPYSAGDPSNTAIPSGSLQVYDGSTLVTVLPINSEGSATFSSNLLSVGSHSIVLKYSGDASFQGSQTNAFNFSISSANTQTTLNPSTLNVGEGGNNADGLTAVVISTTLPSNGSAPSGTVTFSTSTPQTAPLVPGFDPNGNAIATASIAIQPSDVPASGVIHATYNPPNGSNYNGSTSSDVQFTQTTSQYNGTSTVSFTITDANGTYAAKSGLSFPTSDALTLNINVNTDTPNNSYVTIYANGTAISGQIYPDANGNLSFPIPRQNGYLQLPSGQVQFTIQYDGWQEYIFGFPYYQSPPASTTLSVNIADNRTSADFSLQSSTTVNQQTPLTAASPSATFGLQLTSIYNFQSAYATTPINLTCAIPNNPGLKCSFSASSVTLGGSGFATSTMTVSAASGYAIAQSTAPVNPAMRWWMAGGGTALGCLFLFGIPSRRRAWQSTLGVFALAAISLGMGGCATSPANSFNSSSLKANGAPNGTANLTGTAVAPGTYTVVVTATTTTNTTIVHNLPVSVVVTNQ